MTAYCLNLLGRQLGPLKQAEAAGRLVPQVGAPLHARVQSWIRTVPCLFVMAMLPAPDGAPIHGIPSSGLLRIISHSGG